MALTRTADLPYAVHDGVSLCLDVARPAGDAVLPVVLSLHGGGWCAGDRHGHAGASHRLARLGYVVLNVSYRLAPAWPFPAALDDLRAAAAWAATHAAEFGGDPTRLGAFGSSAGGHLVSLLAAMPETPLACAASWGAPMDLRDDPLAATHRGYLLAFMNGCLHEVPERYAAASPAHWIGPHSAPTLLLHGDDDPLVPPRQAALLGAHAEVVRLAGSGHVPDTAADPGFAIGWARIARFFAAHLGGAA
jgi:acetyl esterase/lipase